MKNPKPEDWATVIAIAGNTHHSSLTEAIDLQLYVPYTQEPNWYPPGQIVLRTTGGPHGRTAVLEVVDDGPGIPPGQQAEVFERFARGDSSRSRAAGSTGLGLAIVAAVVEAHHGTVEVASRPGDTRFTVRLPATSGP